MKIDARGNSKFLAKADVPKPLLATMDFVQIETLKNPTEDKPVLHFVGNAMKPLVLNVVNRKVLIAAYGDETDNWKGKPIEIYVNSDVTNSSGETVGGVRVRIPAAPAPAQPAPRAGSRNGTPPLSAPKPVQAPAPKAEPLSQAEMHRIVLDGFANARSEAKVREFATWAKNQDFTPDQDDEQSDAFHAAMERIAMGADVPRRPAPARG